MARQHTGVRTSSWAAPKRHAVDSRDEGVAAELTADRIHHVLSQGSVLERQELVDRLPPHPLKGTVRVLMDSASPCTPVAALAALALQYGLRSDPAVGAALAAALRARAIELVGTESDRDLLSITLSRLALAHSRALASLHQLGDVSTPVVIALAATWWDDPSRPRARRRGQSA
jgi:hypothetical protein